MEAIHTFASTGSEPSSVPPSIGTSPHSVVCLRFTRPVDVLGHELTHAVTEFSAGLRYRDQPGALNESVSDVFGSCLKQWLLGQTVDQADWLVGAGLFLPGVNARGLRDMANPGTAYDDPVLGVVVGRAGCGHVAQRPGLDRRGEDALPDQPVALAGLLAPVSSGR